MLICTPETLRTPRAPEALTLQRVDAHSGPDALRELAAAVGPGTDLRDGLGVLARIAGAPAGGGLFTTGSGGEARIASLGLRDPGDAVALGPVIAAELARLAFRNGARRVVLAAVDDAGPYGAAGFLPTD